jgi:hypothetical protein
MGEVLRLVTPLCGVTSLGVQGVRVLEISSDSARSRRSWNFKYSDPLNHPLNRLPGGRGG